MIPREITFIYLYGSNTYPFNVNHYISICSNMEVNRFTKLRICTNDVDKLTSTEYFQDIAKRYESKLEIITLESISSEVYKITSIDLNRNDIPMAHKADMVRLYLLNNYGGVYSDVDSIAFEPFPENFFSYDKPIFFPEVYEESVGMNSLCNGYFLTPMNSEYLSHWLEQYNEYDPMDCLPGTPDWTKFSVQLGFKLANTGKFPITIIDKASMLEPFYLSYEDTESLFFLDNYWFLEGIGPYQVHLWETRNRDILKVLSPQYFIESYATYAQLGKPYIESYFEV